MKPLTPATDGRAVMNGKPVFTRPARGIINFASGFTPKLLCDGPTFSLGDACAYQCSFCYVPAQMHKLLHDVLPEGKKHEDVVIRREGWLNVLRSQLTAPGGGNRFTDPADQRVIYSSPLVDVAANLDMVRETNLACYEILTRTNWQIRLLSKSNLLHKCAEGLADVLNPDVVRKRVIFGFSTGTLDDNLAAAFEQGTPKVSKRLQSLYWLQDNGFRTFGMICPSLPQRGGGAGYNRFAREMFQAIRADRCEHVWAEVLNVRGDSMERTVKCLREAGYEWEADELKRVSEDKSAWEEYSRATFNGHAVCYDPGKLRFLQYVNDSNKAYWQAREFLGAVLL